jgi:thioredoxin 1
MVTAVTDANFDAEVLKSPTPVLVDFWADWCGPCKMLAPIFSDLSNEYKGKLKFVKLDVDSNERAGEFGVMSIPTMILFHKGKEVDRMVGALPKDRLKAQFDSWLKGLK